MDTQAHKLIISKKYQMSADDHNFSKDEHRGLVQVESSDSIFAFSDHGTFSLVLQIIVKPYRTIVIWVFPNHFMGFWRE